MATSKEKMSPWQIKKIIAKGKQWRGVYFSLKYLKNFAQTAAPARLAVVISKKTLAKAHERNLCRRRVKDAFQKSLDKAQGFDLIIFPTKMALEVQFDKLMLEAQKCLSELQ